MISKKLISKNQNPTSTTVASSNDGYNDGYEMEPEVPELIIRREKPVIKMS